MVNKSSKTSTAETRALSRRAPIPDRTLRRIIADNQSRLQPTKYSPVVLDPYNPERHITTDDAYALVITQKDSRLPIGRLEKAAGAGEVIIYDFKGKTYFDRLDIGRVYHKSKKRKGITIRRFFSTAGEDPFDSVGPYTSEDIILKDADGKTIFEMNGAVFPESWTDNQKTIVAQKYFYCPEEPKWKAKIRDVLGTDHENSLVHMVNRVSTFFGERGAELGYFETPEDKQTFIDELNFLQINRMAAFNSPVYFNAGIYQTYGISGGPSVNFWRDPETGKVIRIYGGCNLIPQSHACFIRSSTDHLPRILEQGVDEGNIFSSGSGVGGDAGVIREDGALLSSGGHASGPLSFMKAWDDGAGGIKSGGKSRRAARMQTMRCYHPDIMAFAVAKLNEDRKALTLLKAGYSTGMDGEAYTSVTFQNTNFSIRLDDPFFEQVANDGEIELRSVTSGDVIRKISARELLKTISFGSWRIGDPGVQYEGQLQKYNTCSNSGRNNSTNPCGEYAHLDDTSCNLASLNLIAFSDMKGNLDVEKYQRANRIIAIAQNIANEASSYPVEDIARISPEFGTIGIGFANLGTWLMRQGIAYDSDEGRARAAAVSAIMTSSAYEVSADLAGDLGTFVHYEWNRKPMLKVIGQHKNNLEDIAWQHVPDEMKTAAYKGWSSALYKGRRNGFRNAQVSVLAPTGTISFMMGCKTTGGEPAIALIVDKELAGGGTITMTMNEVPNALNNLGYSESQIHDMTEFVKSENTMVGAPHIHPDHVNIFATAMGNKDGVGAIPFNGHIDMVAANQPFITGGISKTNNLPENATVRDIYDGFIRGHESGLKGLTVFRQNSKPIYAMGFGGQDFVELRRGEKEDLPTSRPSWEYELSISSEGGTTTPFHIIVSEYPDGRPGQIALLSFKAGSTLKAIFETQGISASKALKRGVSLEDVVSPWIDQDFDPNGMVYGHKGVKTALSPLDAAARVLLIEYMGRLDLANSVWSEDNPKGIRLEDLRGFHNGALVTYRRAEIDDWDRDQVLKDPLFGGFMEINKSDSLIFGSRTSKDGKGNNNSRGLICKSCGHIMHQSGPSCYECAYCPTKIGGCGV